jgi:hypothetical protein
MPNVPSKLFTAFNDVTYYDEPHKYFLDGKELISVTTLIGKYVTEFNEGYWAGVKSKQFNVPPKDVKHGWKYINRIGTERGSIIHDYAENLFNNKIFPYEYDRILKMFGDDPLNPSYKKVKSHVDKFYQYSQGRLIPIKTELVVFDREYGIGGMVDLLFWNVKAQEFQIWDWKTNKDFEGWNPITKYEVEEGKSNFKGPLAFLKDNDINHYSLQLDTYKHIIEKNTGIKLGKSYLLWVSHLQDRFYPIETLNRGIYVQKMIDAYAA